MKVDDIFQKTMEEIQKKLLNKIDTAGKIDEKDILAATRLTVSEMDDKDITKLVSALPMDAKRDIVEKRFFNITMLKIQMKHE